MTQETETNIGVPVRQKPGSMQYGAPGAIRHRTPPLPGTLFPRRNANTLTHPGHHAYARFRGLCTRDSRVSTTGRGRNGNGYVLIPWLQWSAPNARKIRSAIYVSALGPRRAVLTCRHPCTCCARRVSYAVQLVLSQRTRGERGDEQGGGGAFQPLSYALGRLREYDRKGLGANGRDQLKQDEEDGRA